MFLYARWVRFIKGLYYLQIPAVSLLFHTDFLFGNGIVALSNIEAFRVWYVVCLDEHLFKFTLYLMISTVLCVRAERKYGEITYQLPSGSINLLGFLQSVFAFLENNLFPQMIHSKLYIQSNVIFPV